MRNLNLTFLLLACLLFAGVAQSTPLSTLLKSEIGGTELCIGCEMFFGVLDTFLESNTSMQEIESKVVALCLALHLKGVNKPVCEGLVSELGPTVLPILIEVGLPPRETCFRLGACKPSHPKLSEKKENPIQLPPKFIKSNKVKFQNVKDDRVVGTILQLSDLHYDELYCVGCLQYCNEPLCCRVDSSGNASSTNKAPKWGAYPCDIPFNTFDALLQAAAAVKPDFVVVTGDNTPHDIWQETKEVQMERLATISGVLQDRFGNIPVFPAIGNHDTFPVDQFSLKPKDSVHHDDFQWLLSGLTEAWGPWLRRNSSGNDGSALKTFREQGYYTMVLTPGLRVISMNTQWGDFINFYLFLDEHQGRQQFNWMVDTLTAAEKAGEKVIIIGHIAVNCAAPRELSTYSTDYVNIINRFSHIIVGQFFGHTHDDDFTLIYDQHWNPTSVVYLAPSVTTFGWHNPGFRVYKYNKDFEIVDYDQYNADLGQANQNDKPEWNLIYSARSEYNMSDLSAKSWNDLVTRFENDDSLFQKWYHNFATGTINTPCDAKCKKHRICAIQSSLETKFFC